MALPFLTGFYSKDLILELMYGEFYLAFGLWLGLLAAFVKAFYSFRLIYYTFAEYSQSSPVVFSGSHEGNWRLITPLIVLFILSILGGFLLEFYLLDDLFPIMIPNFNKLLPLVISLSGAILAIFWGVLTYNSWHYFVSKSFMKIYAFLSGAWYFDTLIKKVFINPLLRIGFSVTYKLIDNQILEEFGPTRVSQTTFDMANSISKVHLGKISFYAFILVLFITFLFIQF
jgi:NADH-ubiquinone oxidoreductase chain 5